MDIKEKVEILNGVMYKYFDNNMRRDLKQLHLHFPNERAILPDFIHYLTINNLDIKYVESEFFESGDYMIVTAGCPLYYEDRYGFAKETKMYKNVKFRLHKKYLETFDKKHKPLTMQLSIWEDINNMICEDMIKCMEEKIEVIKSYIEITESNIF